MSERDEIGHLAYKNGESLPGLCHCPRNEAHPVADDEQSQDGFWLLPGAGSDVTIIDCFGAGGKRDAEETS